MVGKIRETTCTNHRTWVADCIVATDWLGNFTTLSASRHYSVRW
jgi:hypothetical protein